MTAHTHCNHCGTAYTTLEWPRKCDSADCGKMTWANPIPVAVAVTEVYLDETGEGNVNRYKYLGLLGVKRKISPIGLALPGGFVDNGENWTDGLTREIDEEVGSPLAAEQEAITKGKAEAVLSTPDGTRILIFGRTDALVIASLEDLEPMGHSNETEGVVILNDDNIGNIVFSLHEQVAKQAHDHSCLMSLARH